MEQIPEEQARAWHSVSCPGQSEASVQPVQVPWPSQVSAPPQDVPALAFVVVTCPPLHPRTMHGLLEAGAS
jgi:hypothetical protein